MGVRGARPGGRPARPSGREVPARAWPGHSGGRGTLTGGLARPFWREGDARWGGDWPANREGGGRLPWSPPGHPGPGRPGGKGAEGRGPAGDWSGYPAGRGVPAGEAGPAIRGPAVREGRGRPLGTDPAIRQGGGCPLGKLARPSGARPSGREGGRPLGDWPGHLAGRGVPAGELARRSGTGGAHERRRSRHGNRRGCRSGHVRGHGAGGRGCERPQRRVLRWA